MAEEHLSLEGQLKLVVLPRSAPSLALTRFLKAARAKANHMSPGPQFLHLHNGNRNDTHLERHGDTSLEKT
jgi:hypothetical protein